MRPSVVFEQNRELIRELTVRRRMTNPRVFGSVLHGTDTEGSDIDLLVDTLPDTTLFDLGGLQEDLAERLGVTVQVVTPRELSRYFRDKVLAEAQPV
ncbi:nucleotidyltransferase family protein [Devosia sp.]|uniref:nucleotidyltransferase family protein n=1 Tax=Devosia sp. TaxID=1871048 RepID=UPI0035AF25BF